MKSKGALIVAVVLGLLSALLVHNYIQSKTRGALQGQRPMRVAYANKQFHAGDKVTDPDAEFAAVEMPALHVPPDAISWSDRDRFKGRVINFDLRRDDMLLHSHFAGA